ncbi:hypothetical protein B0H12DRAFT_1225407 [Mycena haematopus]|nr:hypothetical protein B0H12DRAFT_1225407 [Mycena haematopus]
MPCALEDEIDGFGLDQFSPNFLEELERAEEAFPSSFCGIPPTSQATETSDDEYDSMFVEPCSQEVNDALHAMEQPDFVFSSQGDSSPVTRRSISSILFPTCGQPPATNCSTPSRYYFDVPFNSKLTVYEKRVCLKLESISPTVSSPFPDSCKKYKLSSLPVTHLSQFFSSYPKYEYDPSGPASQQFQKLKCVYKASPQDTAEIKAGFNRALGLMFSQVYGDEVNSLENWQRLCRVVEIDPIPGSLQACRFAIKRAHVNLMDLLDTQTTGEPVHRFATEEALSEYTKCTRKIFPRDDAYKGPLLRHLLRRIFHRRRRT